MAIALLPLGEGETIGSNIGRYVDLMCPRNFNGLMKSLFGYAYAPNTRLPSAIYHLAQQTKDYWNLTGEEIVRNFTEFQYVTLVCSQPTREKLMGRMLAPPPSNVRAPLRLIKYNIERMTKLRYCSECIREWRNNREPFYWKIDHQLAGVYFCTKHSCVLKSVGKVYSERGGVLTVTKLIGNDDEVVFDNGTPSEMAAVESVARLSVRQRVSGDVHEPEKLYRERFRDAGFTHSTNSTLRRNIVIPAWQSYFGAQYCHATGMSAARISAWINNLANCAVQRELPHPFMYIAADCFLEYHASSPGSFLPRGRDESPDLSSTLNGTAVTFETDLCQGALHRGSDFIKFAGSSRGSGGNKLVCTCGISYRMPGDEQSETKKLRPFIYGTRYRARFRALIAKGKTPITVARELNLAESTAKNWARREKGSDVRTMSQREVNKLRIEWRLLVEDISSEHRITTAAKSKPILYKTLHKNDREWLIEFNRGYRSWRPQSSYKTNEATRDEIREAYVEVMLVEPPIRATKAAILEKAGDRGGARRDRHFAAFLDDLAESLPAYRERVISWLATHASGQELGTCDEGLRRVGVRLRSFTEEQRRRIREIESTRR